MHFVLKETTTPALYHIKIVTMVKTSNDQGKPKSGETETSNYDT